MKQGRSLSNRERIFHIFNLFIFQLGRFLLYIVASLIGFLAGLVTWFVGSYGIAQFISWGSTRQPSPVNAKALKVYEMILCGILFFISVAVLFSVARAMWPETS
jgi:hypothetical protein